MFRNIQGNKARKVDCCCVFSACILKPELGLLVNDFVFIYVDHRTLSGA